MPAIKQICRCFRGKIPAAALTIVFALTGSTNLSGADDETYVVQTVAQQTTLLPPSEVKAGDEDLLLLLTASGLRKDIDQRRGGDTGGSGVQESTSRKAGRLDGACRFLK